MNGTTLLTELEQLSFSQRIRRVVTLGQEARSSPQAAARLATLRDGFYERLLALHACYGSGDSDYVLRALSDPSQTIRALAVRLAALFCNDEQLATALVALPAHEQRRLLKSLHHSHRLGPIDAFLGALGTQNDQRLAAYLPFGSPALVAGLLDQALLQAGRDDWRRLARFHPPLAAATLQRQINATTHLDQRLLWIANAVVPELAESLPDEALALVESLLRQVPLGQLSLETLLRRRPNAMADLLLRSTDQARLDFAPVVRRLDTAQIILLVRRGALPYPHRWLRQLDAEGREAVYAATGLGWRDSEGVVSLETLALLPGAARMQEARRLLALPMLQTRPAGRLPYAGLLPWNEAVALLEPFARHPTPELRAVALAALIASSRYDRGQLAQVVQLVRDRRNEQDPVRQAMLTALAALPPGRWQPEQLPGLTEIVRDALDAADCSPATAAAAEGLILALLPFHPAWSAASLATLVQERGRLSGYSLADRLSDSDVQRIAPALLPVLRAWESREREEAIFQTARLFGRRLKAFPQLVALLERLADDLRGRVASQALLLLAGYHRDSLPTLVPRLVAADPSWITQQPVSMFLHRRRQDLLTPFLGQNTFSGRFSTGKTRFVLPLGDGFHRWTPFQQELFAQTLTALTRDEVRDTPALAWALRQLAALPAIQPGRLIELASLQNPRLAVREQALRQLGKLDAGQGLSTLLAALDDERARVAIYALRSSLLRMPAQQALALLRAVPLGKVTVAKEVIRLLGELPGTLAYDDLLALDAQNLHRDVRVALLRALWDHLEQPQTWPILEQAAASADAAIADGVIRIPAERCTAEALRRLLSLLVLLLAHPDPLVRLDTLRRCGSLPVTDAERLLAPVLLRSCESPLPDECAAAAQAVFSTYAGRDASEVGPMVARVLPNRRALLTVVQALRTAVSSSGSLLPTARAVLMALAADPLTATLQIELAVNALPWDELAELLQGMRAANTLHADASAAAVAALASVWYQRADSEGIAGFERKLAMSDDAQLRRIALAALVAPAQAGPLGWDSERRERLETYRSDSAALVAAAAQFTLPPAGEEPPARDSPFGH